MEEGRGAASGLPPPGTGWAEEGISRTGMSNLVEHNIPQEVELIVQLLCYFLVLGNLIWCVMGQVTGSIKAAWSFVVM